MPASVFHNVTVTGADEPGKEVNSIQWNSAHAVSLNMLGSEVSNAFNNGGGITFGLETNGSITAAAPAGAPSPVNFSAGTTSNNLGSVVFSNLNGLAFGLDGSTITGSYTVPTTGGITGSHNSANHSGNIIPAAVQDFGNFAYSLGTAAQPAASAGRLNFYGFNEQGKTRFGMVTPDGSQITHAQDTFIIARNTSGGVIGAGKAVYVTGSTGQTPNISPAKADAAATMPAIGVTVDSISNNAFGRVMIGGIADGLNTLAFTEGDRLWVSETTAGDLTVTEPPYPNLRQRVAIVVNSHATQGKLLVLIAGARGEFGIQAVSAGTTQMTSGGVVFSNSNGVSFGVDGNTVTASHNGLTTAAASDHSHGNPTLALTNLTGTTASASNGFTLSLSAAAAGAGGFQSAGFSTQGNTSGDTGFASQSLQLVGGNNITLSGSTNAGGLTLTISGPNAGGAQTGISGIVVSNATYTSGTVSFSNANGISFGSSAGQAITASYTVPAVPPETPFGLSAGTQSVSTGTLVFSNSNGISFGMSGSSRITASYTVPTQSTQPVAISGSNGSFAFSTATFGSSNGMHFYTTNGSVVGSYTVPAVPPETPFGLSAGTQSVSTGTLVFSNSNGITFGMSGSSRITASHDGLTTAAASNHSHGVSFTSGSVGFQTLSFTNSNGFSFNSGTQGIFGSYTVPTVTNSSWTVSDAATSGTVGRLAFTNLNGITLSLSTGAAGSHTIVGSHNALTSQSNQAVSNSAGSFTFQTLNFSNANNVTWGTSAGGIVTASVAAPGAAAEANAINLLGANTAGNTTVTGSTLGFSGVNMTLSGTNASQLVLSVPATSSLSAITNITIGTTGSTIGFSVGAGGGAGTVDRYLRLPILTQAGSLQNNSSVSIFPFNIGGNLAISNARFAMSLSGASTINTSSAGMAMSISMVLYTRNGSTLSSLNSGSQTYSGFYQSNSISQTFGGPRGFTVNFASATTLAPDEYWLALHVSTATSGQTSLAKSISMGVLPSQGSAFMGLDPFMVATTNTRGAMVGLGVFSTGATRGTIAFTDLTGQAGVSATLANLWCDLRNWSIW